MNACDCEGPMKARIIAFSVLALVFADALGPPPTCLATDEPRVMRWTKVIENVWRTEVMPYGYAVVEDDRCLLIGAPLGAAPGSLPPRVRRCDVVLLTHQHRDSSWNASEFVRAGISVRASKLSEAYLSPNGVAAYWRNSMPQVDSRRFPNLFERYWGDWTCIR